MNIPTDDLTCIRNLYERDLFLQAFAAAARYQPLQQLQSAESRLMAGRLAMNLGAPRLRHWLHLQAYRADRKHPEAQYYYLRLLLERKGPLAAWNFLKP